MIVILTERPPSSFDPLFCGSGRVRSEETMHLEITVCRQKEMHRSFDSAAKNAAFLKLTAQGDE